MAYVTLQDLIDRFGQDELIQLTDRANVPPTTVDETVVGKHIADAEALIDSHVGRRYQLPLEAVPPVLTKYAADLARYFLHGDAAEKDSPVERNYREAVRWLELVSKGAIVIENAGVIPADAGGGQVQSSGPERVFTRDSLEGF